MAFVCLSLVSNTAFIDRTRYELTTSYLYIETPLKYKKTAQSTLI
jgi:hypothetical protein